MVMGFSSWGKGFLLEGGCGLMDVKGISPFQKGLPGLRGVIIYSWTKNHLCTSIVSLQTICTCSVEILRAHPHKRTKGLMLINLHTGSLLCIFGDWMETLNGGRVRACAGYRRHWDKCTLLQFVTLMCIASRYKYTVHGNYQGDRRLEDTTVRMLND